MSGIFVQGSGLGLAGAMVVLVEESTELLELVFVLLPHEAVKRPSAIIIAMHFIVFIEIIFFVNRYKYCAYSRCFAK